MTSLRDLAHSGVRWTGLSAVATALAQVARLVILARFFLTPAEFGLFALTTVYAGFVTIFLDAGFSQVLVQRQNASREEISSIFWITILIGVAAFVLSVAASPLVADYFKAPSLTLLLQVSAIQFLIQPLGRQFEALLSKDLAFRTLGLIEILSNLVSLVVAVVAAMLGAGVWALVASILAGTLFKTVALLIRGVPLYPLLLRLKLGDLRHVAGFSLFQLAERMVNTLAERLDQLLLGRFLGVEAVGLYNVAFQSTAMAVSRINPIVTRVAFPVFAYVQNDRERLKRGYIEVTELLMVINAPLLVGFCAVAQVAIPLMFGSKWNGAIPLVQLLCFVSLARSVGNPVGSLLLAKGRADWGFYWNLALLVLSVPAIVVGALSGGAIGVAIALVAIQLVLFFPNYLFLIRPLTGPCGAEYFGAIFRPLLWSLAMGFAVLLVGYLSTGHPWLTLIFQIIFGIIVYCAILVWVRPSVAVRILDTVPASPLVRLLGAAIGKLHGY